MKNKQFRKLPVVLLTLLSATSCGEAHPLTRTIVSKIDFDYWTTYGTSKVLRNIRDESQKYAKLGNELTIEMVQNEIEGAQVIVTPKGKDMAYVDVEVSDLLGSNGAKIDSDAIKVYYQKYIKIDSPTNNNNNYKEGDMVPDMLLPFEAAKSSKENFVYGGTNQGLTFEVDSKGVPSGDYQGSVRLTVGDKVINMPFKVTVWPVELSGKRSFKSSFLLYRNELINGEYDNSQQMVDNYVDMLLDYKVNTYVIQSVADNSVDNFVREFTRNWDNDNYSSIVIPLDFPQSYTYTDQEYTRCQAYIEALVKRSTPENPYLDYAYFYPSSYDEADLDPYKAARSEVFFSKGGELDKTLARINESLEPYYQTLDAEWANHLKDRVLNIPAILTNTSLRREWVSSFHATFSPYMSLYNNMDVIQRYQDSAALNNDGNLWAYTCCDPLAPYPTFHIDDDALPMRVNGWMNRQLGINGYLYYEVNKNSKFFNGVYEEENVIDVYNDPLRYELSYGDGYLVYPGRKYGLSSPIPSNRLVSYRDGNDDYDILGVLEEKLMALADKYEINDLRMNEYLSDIYSSLFKASITKTNETNFFQKRREIIEKISELDNPDELLVYKTYEGGKAYDNFLLNKSTLVLDGNNVSSSLVKSGSGYLYKTLSRDNSHDFEITIGSNAYRKSVHGSKALTDFVSSTSNVISNSESTSSLRRSGDEVSITLKKNRQNDQGAYIGIGGVNGLADVANLFFEYQNDNDFEVNFRITLFGEGYGDAFVCTNYCLAHSSRKLQIDMTNVSQNALKYCNQIRLSFDNDLSELNSGIKLKVKDFYALMKGGN